jgi:hypothetical protein
MGPKHRTTYRTSLRNLERVACEPQLHPTPIDIVAIVEWMNVDVFGVMRAKSLSDHDVQPLDCEKF